MTTPLLSLDIRDDLVSGVLVQPNHKATVAGCGAAAVGTLSLKEAIAEVVSRTGFQDGPCRVSFSSRHFFFRNLSLPFTDNRKINKILPFELEETAPMEVGKLLVDAISTQSERNTTEVIAAMVERTFLADRLALLLELGLDPEIITISGVQVAVRQMETSDCPTDFLLLDIGPQLATLIVVLNRRIVLIRPLEFGGGTSGAEFRFEADSLECVAAGPEWLPEACRALADAVRRTLLVSRLGEPGLPVFLTGAVGGLPAVRTLVAEMLGAEVEECDLLKRHPSLKISAGLDGRWRPGIMNQALALGIPQVKNRTGFNFRKETFARKISLRRYRRQVTRSAAVVGVCLFIAVISFWFNYLSKKAEEKRLTTEIQKMFTETLPSVTRIVDPVKQLQVEIDKLKKETGGERISSDYKVLDVLAEISQCIPATLPVHLSLMVADEKGIRLIGETDTFNAVDAIKKKLNDSPYFSSVAIGSANLSPKGGGIRFELRLQLSGT